MNTLKDLSIPAILILLMTVGVLLLREHYERHSDAFWSFHRRCEAAGGQTIGYESPTCVTDTIDVDKVCVTECRKAEPAKP